MLFRSATQPPPAVPQSPLAAPPVPPGLLSPMTLGLAVRPATGVAITPPPPPVPGTYQPTPPGRLSPMSIGLPLYFPPSGSGQPPPPVVTIPRGQPPQGADDKPQLKKLLMLTGW